MFRFRSALKFVAPLALLLATSALSLTSTSARAEWEEMGRNEDGSATLWYNDATGVFAVYIEKNGKYSVHTDGAVVKAMLEKLGFGTSNPSPDDPTDGKGTSKPSADALKKFLKDAAAVEHKAPINSKLGGIIEQGGGGKGPKWNPGPDDDGNPSGGPSSKDKPEGPSLKEMIAKQKAINVAIRNIENIKGGMFDGSEGGTESAPTVGKGPKSDHGNNGSNGGGDGDGPPDKPNIDTDELGPKPEVVNPPYFKTPGVAKAKATTEVKKAKTAALDTKGKTGGNGKSTNGKSSGPSVLMSPGLLGGGPGLGTNGPSSAGAALGGMGAGPTTGPATRLR